MELSKIVNDISHALLAIDFSRVPFKNFQPGVGPYGEPQLVRAIIQHLNALPAYSASARVQRTPVLLIPGHWAIEIKLARPFGDNGKEAEDWSVNLLHPYEGSTSLIGDCLKLERLSGSERRAAVVVGYEHTPPQISLAPLLQAFEVVATTVVGVRLGARQQIVRTGLVHPVHQQLTVAAWEVLGAPRREKACPPRPAA
jgi:hypothetical protein